MVSHDSNAGTVRGGALVTGPGNAPVNVNGKGTVGRAQEIPVASRWDGDLEDDDGDVFADASGGPVEAQDLGHFEQEADLDVGEELDDRTMLDSVILPIISSVSPFLSSHLFLVYSLTS